MANTNGLNSLTLFDYTDRELLLIVMEEADKESDGYVDTKSIADAIGVQGDHRLNSVGSRMAVLRRIGAVEKPPPDQRKPNSLSRWNVSPRGRELATGKLRATTERALDALGPEQMILLMRFVAGRWSSSANTEQQLVRREWVHGTGRKR